MQPGEEVASGLFIAGRDASKMLDDVKKSLNQIALAIEHEVTFAFDFAIGFWWNDDLNTAGLKIGDVAVRVIALVAEHRARIDPGSQRFGLLDVVDLPAREAELQRVAQSIDNRMNLRRQPTARTPYCLVRSRFFWAPALC